MSLAPHPAQTFVVSSASPDKTICEPEMDKRTDFYYLAAVFVEYV